MQSPHLSSACSKLQMPAMDVLPLDAEGEQVLLPDSQFRPLIEHIVCEHLSPQGPHPGGWRSRLESYRPMEGNKPALRHSFKPQRTDLMDDCPGGCRTALGVGGPPQVMEWAPECAATSPIMFITQGQGLLWYGPMDPWGLPAFLRLGRQRVCLLRQS